MDKILVMINELLTEIKKYTVSPKFRDTQKEWGLALEDSNFAGKYVIIVANDIKNRRFEFEI